ncbi:hypothetical protein ABZ671_19340 [Micromonospora sp. NPDC006766]|uniref:hypothetical protein n=1 Tax=Micromonospora sp. NPDC006766 TaxID=3154778 RepID=UPI0033EB2A28
MQGNPDSMLLTITGLESLPVETRRALQDVLTKRGSELIEEAGRLEADTGGSSTAPMITPSLINHLDIWQRRGYIKPKKSKTSTAWTTVTLLATFVGGHFVNNITKPWGAIGFVVCALIALLSHSRGSES